MYKKNLIEALIYISMMIRDIEHLLVIYISSFIFKSLFYIKSLISPAHFWLGLFTYLFATKLILSIFWILTLFRYMISRYFLPIPKLIFLHVNGFLSCTEKFLVLPTCLFLLLISPLKGADLDLAPDRRAPTWWRTSGRALLIKVAPHQTFFHASHFDATFASWQTLTADKYIFYESEQVPHWKIWNIQMI